MKHWALLSPLFLAVSFSTISSAQNWSGILAPSRATDWSQAGATIVNRQTVCATVSLTAGSSNAAANTTAITNAINSCGTTGTPPASTDNVIQLPAGTFYINAFTITRNNFTLRGAGADQTLLIAATIQGSSTGGVILLRGNPQLWRGGNFTTANWTAGYAQGTTSLTLDSYTNLLVGSQVILDQVEDNILGGDTGDIYACGTTAGTTTIDPTCGDSGNTIDNGRTNRVESQTVTITACGTKSALGAACDGGNVTISPGLFSPNWNRHPGSSLPQAWWGTGLPITGVGLENFSLDASALSAQTGTITFWSATNCWAKGLRVINSTTNQIWMHFLVYVGTHVTVADNYMYGSSPTSGGYGVDFADMSSDDLAQNNICNHVASCMVSEGTQGSIYAYNYAADNYYTGGGSATSWQQQDEDHHSIGDNYNLYEGNIGSGIGLDKIHGGSWMLTIFRSYSSGRDSATASGTKTQSTIALNAYMLNRYVNAVGNVLGTAGYHTIYEWYPSSASDPGSSSSGDHSVLAIGWSGNEGTKGSNNNDLIVRQSMFRWGNWDDVTNAVRWCTGASTPITACTGDERGLSAPVYPGLSSPSQTLPASFYLPSRPTWWVFPSGNSSTPFPAIGPDVTGGNIANVGGYAYLTPAANCYLNVMGGLTNGTSGALTFNANSCYGASSVGSTPAPPTGLSGTVQ